MFGWLSLLSMVACGRIEGAPSEVVQNPGHSVTLPAPAGMGGGGKLPAGISEYVFLHHARYENIPVHALAGAKSCPE
jgi:hypothetical protein